MPRHILKKLLLWGFWILVWQAADLLIHNPILMAGPIQVCRSLAACLPDPDFWLTLASSLSRIILGFSLALAAGLLFGALSFAFPLLDELLEPVMGMIRSVPVASFVILALIWIGSVWLSMFITFLVVLPIIYVNTRTGLSCAPRELLEMAQVFRVPRLKVIRCIYIPALMPSLQAGCCTAMGLAWKSGAAAEVIGLPSHSIGEQLYYSKLYLDTAGLFSWTAVVVAASALCSRLLLGILSLASRRLGRPKGGDTDDSSAEPAE